VSLEPGREQAGFGIGTRASASISRWSGPAVDNSTCLAIVTADANLTRQGQGFMACGRQHPSMSQRRSTCQHEARAAGLTRNWTTHKKAEAFMYV
jgi:hypothetical protein